MTCQANFGPLGIMRAWTFPWAWFRAFPAGQSSWHETNQSWCMSLWGWYKEDPVLRADFGIRYWLQSLPSRYRLCRSSWKGNRDYSLILKIKTNNPKHIKLTFLEHLICANHSAKYFWEKSFVLKSYVSLAWCVYPEAYTWFYRMPGICVEGE